MKRTAVLTLLLAGACIPAEGPMMAPGQDCLGCHGGAGGEGKAWTAAGTWARGAKVSIADASGKSVALRGNDAGNFYTAEKLVFPLTVSVDGRVMTDPSLATTANPAPPARLGYGGCNRCHASGGGVATGPLMAPGQDCLGCHDGAVARRFYAAGTFKPSDAVIVGGRAFTANSVGNFFTTDPIALPTTASVNGVAMSPDPSYGGCNRCHNGTVPAATGPLMAPGQDCLGCHGPGGAAAKKFSAAGTFRPGDRVTVGGNAFTANSVGNFYIDVPIAFPATARVNAATMSPNPDYGGCNRCHGPGGAAGGGD